MVKKNKKIKIVSNIIYTIFMLIMIVLIFTVARERFTGKEPSLFGYKLYTVESGSMIPELKINSLIIVKKTLPKEIEIGDIITYYGKRSSTRVTHRVVDVGGENEYFITRGDANNVEDSLPVEKERVVGKVIYSIPYLGYILKFLSSIQGIVFIVSMGILWMIFPIILKKQNYQECNEKDG